MLVEEEKLRWMGIDMRSRTRRRVAVVATYAAFLYAVLVRTPRVYEVIGMLWCGVLMIWGVSLMRGAVAKWLRILVWTLALVFVGLSLFIPRRPAEPFGLNGAMIAMLVLSSASVVGVGRLVGSGESGWLADAMRKGSRLNWKGQRQLWRCGFLYGLDGFAFHEYGVRFRDLTEDQQAVVRQMRRSYPQGKWMPGMERKVFDDERLRLQENEVRAAVQGIMTFVLLCSAFWWTWKITSASHQSAPAAHEFGDAFVAWAWTVYALALTLRQAIVLWTEEDPRGVSDELHVMQEQEA